MKKQTKRAELDSLKELDDLQNRLRSLFSEGGTDSWTPTLNFSEEKKSYLITVNLTGKEKGDVSVSIENDDLSLACDRGSGLPYIRIFPLPPEVDAGKISAVFGEEVLVIRLPKAVSSPVGTRHGKREVPVE